jgi:hypothetical protein
MNMWSNNSRPVPRSEAGSLGWRSYAHYPRAWHVLMDQEAEV